MKNKVKKFRSPDPGGLTRDTIKVGEANVGEYTSEVGEYRKQRFTHTSSTV